MHQLADHSWTAFAEDALESTLPQYAEIVLHGAFARIDYFCASGYDLLHNARISQLEIMDIRNEEDGCCVEICEELSSNCLLYTSDAADE